MPVADYQTYCRMLDNARDNEFAYPAINVTSIASANAALRGFAEKKSDGIIQASSGGGQFASGLAIKDMALGAITIAEHVHRIGTRHKHRQVAHGATGEITPDLFESTGRRRGLFQCIIDDWLELIKNKDIHESI